MDHTEKKLWENYWQNSSDNLSPMNYYLPIVRQIASKVYSQHSDIAQMDDLRTSGIFGMMDAIEGYSPNSTIDFKDFCEPIIKQAMMKDLYWADIPMVWAWAKLKREQKLIVILHYCEKSTFSEISSLLDIPVEKVESTYHSTINSLPSPEVLRRGRD